MRFVTIAGCAVALAALCGACGGNDESPGATTESSANAPGQAFAATLTIQPYDVANDECPASFDLAAAGDWHCPVGHGEGTAEGIGEVTTTRRIVLDFTGDRDERRMIGTLEVGDRGTLEFSAELVRDPEHSFSTGVWSYRIEGGTGSFEDASGEGTLRATGTAVDTTEERWTGRITGVR